MGKLKGAELRAAQEAEKAKREAAKGGGNGKGTIEAPTDQNQGIVEKTVEMVKGFLNQPDQPQEQPAQTPPTPTPEPIPAPQKIDVVYVNNLGNMLIELKKERDADKKAIEELRQQVTQLSTGSVDLAPIIKEIQTAFAGEKAKIEDAIKATMTEMRSGLAVAKTELEGLVVKSVNEVKNTLKDIKDDIPKLKAGINDAAKASRLVKAEERIATAETVLDNWKKTAENLSKILAVKPVFEQVVPTPPVQTSAIQTPIQQPVAQTPPQQQPAWWAQQ